MRSSVAFTIVVATLKVKVCCLLSELGFVQVFWWSVDLLNYRLCLQTC